MSEDDERYEAMMQDIVVELFGQLMAEKVDPQFEAVDKKNQDITYQFDRLQEVVDESQKKTTSEVEALHQLLTKEQQGLEA